MIMNFDEAQHTDGVDAFQAEILKLLGEYGMTENVVMHPDKLGGHPDNRESSGLVAIDVHDLLLRIVHIGWNWDKVDVLAAQIPPTEEGKRWREFSVKVAASADGLLAAGNPDDLEAVTGRGSHTTASVRCMMHGVKGIHNEICFNGHVSLAKILEAMPSMNEPSSKGLPVKLVKREFCAAVPRLMELLSRSGNTAHSVNRKSNVLQQLTRCHSIVMKYPDKDDESIDKMAALGQAIGFEAQAGVLIQHLKTQGWDVWRLLDGSRAVRENPSSEVQVEGEHPQENERHDAAAQSATRSDGYG
jgi:hypothetical protein